MPLGVGGVLDAVVPSHLVVGPTEENSACVRVVGFPPISTAPTLIALVELAGDATEPAPTSL